MNKTRKMLTIILVLVFIVICFNYTHVLGLSTTIDTTQKNEMTTSKAAVNNIWGSLKLILQIVSVSMVIASGIRYMFASADQKADIKKSLGILVIGCILVFGTTIVIDFIIDVSKEVFVY